MMWDDPEPRRRPLSNAEFRRGLRRVVLDLLTAAGLLTLAFLLSCIERLA